MNNHIVFQKNKVINKSAKILKDLDEYEQYIRIVLLIKKIFLNQIKSFQIAYLLRIFYGLFILDVIY